MLFLYNFQLLCVYFSVGIKGEWVEKPLSFPTTLVVVMLTLYSKELRALTIKTKEAQLRPSQSSFERKRKKNSDITAT